MNPILLITSNNNRGGGTVTPSDFVEWYANTVLDNSPTSDGDYFWQNPDTIGLRASLHYWPGAYSIVTMDGYKYFKLHIDPDTPDAGVGLNNYRAEVERNDDTTAIGTKKIVGSGFRFEEILVHGNELVIGQWHTGSSGAPPNNPAIYLGLAYAGQAGADLNELVLVRKIQGFEHGNSGRINTGVVIEAGIDYFLRQTLIGGTGSAGYYKLELKEGRGGSWSTLYEANESTIWNMDSDGGSVSQVTPYWKVGMYGQGIKTDAAVAAEKALNGGIYNIEMYLTDKIKTADLLLGDPLYNSPSLLTRFDPST